MTDTTESVRPVGGSARRSRRRRRRRQLIVAVTAGVVAVAGAGSAWAMSGSDSPRYRLVTAARADVGQTVDADGTLSAADTAALSFATAGTVSRVLVAVGDTVTAGQTIATLDPAGLDAAVTSAESALATAKQTLANDQEAQLNGTTVSSTPAGSGSTPASTSNQSAGATSSAVTVDSAVTITLTAATKPTATGSVAAVKAAQRAVVKAQQALDKAITAQDAAVADLVTSCAASDDSTPSTVTVTADGDGTVAGAAGSSKAVVTLRTTDGELAETSSSNPQRLAAGDRWSFGGLAAGTTDRVERVRSNVIDSADCTTAVSTVVTNQRDVDRSSASLATASSALDKAITALPAGTTGTGTTAPAGSQTTTGGAKANGTTGGSTTGGATTNGTTSNGTTNGSSTGVLVTAARIAADTKAVDAKQAALALATQNRRNATLTTSLAGTVAAVAIAKGDSVTASSSTATITVVGAGTLSSVVDIGIADIDLVKVGQSVAVSVDGRTSTLPAHVTFIGTSNSADSTSSSASYPVTIALDRRDAALYDGMGAGLAIDVGTAKNVLTVPLSAVHTTGNRTTVNVYSGSSEGATVTVTTVTLGLVGNDRVQIKSGLEAGQQVVLAEVSAAVPSSGDNTNRRGGTGDGPPAGGPPAGR